MKQHTVPRHGDNDRREVPTSLLADLASLTAVLEATEPETALVEPAPQPWSPEAADVAVTTRVDSAAPVLERSHVWLPRGTGVDDPAGATPERAATPDDADLATEIDAIIQAGGPTIVFQPVVHIETGRVIGAEALSRFPGPLDTREWFDAADRLGLGDELELSAVHAALRRLDTDTWQRVGWDFLGLNVSTRVVFDPRFVDLLTSYPAERLVIELTEQSALPALPVLRGQLEALRDLRVRVAVNGVKATPANVDRVMMIEPELVKLDVDFTAALVRDPERRDDATDLLDRCRRAGVSVVAVGVEAGDELTTLRRLGIDAVQGHLFGLPFDVGCPTDPT